MSTLIERTIRVVDSGDRTSQPAAYWRTRPVDQRLAEVLSLHREGNALFKGGNPPFVFQIRPRHVVDTR